MQILDNHTQRVNRDLKIFLQKTVMKRAYTATTKQNNNQELFFNPLQIFLLTFWERGSKRGRGVGLAVYKNLPAQF
ncbi:hypothetical protein [Salmonella phage vB_SalM_SPJ41]|uniref:Uncharacterized protein n=1 Tax=Salmonella phage vB_SalM_SPJ41 TaxID=2961840 RepID=A0A9E7T7Z8_9CAUD|nr:hypothetical protein [Salmonella phage vB_SalM_SPJ41]